MSERTLRGVAARIDERIPRPDQSSDFVSMGYALRHIADVAAAFGEFHRVLRPGGRLLVLEITKPAGRIGTALLKTYMRAVVPAIARVVGVPVAAGALYPFFGILLSPMLASAAMTFSSVSVILNALRLRRVEL